jgi:hypothetical protein
VVAYYRCPKLDTLVVKLVPFIVSWTLLIVFLDFVYSLVGLTYIARYHIYKACLYPETVVTDSSQFSSERQL